MGNVILMGFMGAGKSSIARKLSYRLKRPMIDTDKQIEKEQGSTIREIFEKQGEEAFRKMETELLVKLKKSSQQIISLGGGTPLRVENQPLLKELGYVVYLKVSADTIFERLKNDTTRPLLMGPNPKEKIETLLEQRKEIYEKVADFVVNTNEKSFEQILTEIQEEIERHEAVSDKRTQY